MTKEKTAILFISGIVFFFGGIISFLQFFYHPPQEVKGISIKRESSVRPTMTKPLTPSASPSPTIVATPTTTLVSPIQQSFIPKKPKVPASSQLNLANWTQVVATITNEESPDPTASDSAASSSAGHVGSVDTSSPGHGNSN